MSAAEKIAPVHILRPENRHKPRRSPARHYNAHVEAIAERVATHFAVLPAEIFSTSRTATVVKARDVVAHVCRARWEHTREEIGRYLGKDGSSVFAALRRADRLLATAPPELVELVRQLVEREVVTG